MTKKDEPNTEERLDTKPGSDRTEPKPTDEEEATTESEGGPRSSRPSRRPKTAKGL